MKQIFFMLVIAALIIIPACTPSPSASISQFSTTTASTPSLTFTSTASVPHSPVATVTSTSMVIPTPVSTITTVPITPSIKFNGEVSRGETFEKQISPNLTFRLLYYKGDGEGWEVWVGDKAKTDNNFSEDVTPPFYGLNSRYIEGWHFRNSNNSGPRDPNDPGVPQEMRRFYFVLNETDYQRASDSLRKILWPDDYSEEEVKQAEQVYNEIETMSGKTGEGKLVINDLKLGNLIQGHDAWIDNMRFEVEIYLPSKVR